MTTMQDSGVVDMSGTISSLLRSYQDVLTTYQKMLTSDPDGIARAGATLQDQASALSSVSGDLGQRSSTLSGTWEGTAHNTFNTATGQLTSQVDSVAAMLRDEANKMSEAANLLREGKSQMDTIVANFKQAAQTLINESRTAAVGAVNQFVQAAMRLGQSASDAAKKVADEVNEGLGKLFRVEADSEVGKAEHELGKSTWNKLDGSKPADGKQSKAVPWSKSKEWGTKPPAEEDNSKVGKLIKDTDVTLAKGGGTLYDGEWAKDKIGDKADMGNWGIARGTAGYEVGPKVTDSYSAGFSDGDLQAKGDVKATLADANVSGTYNDGPLSAHASGDASLGANASGKLSVGEHGFQAGVSGFAGAQVKGDVGADVAGVGLGASGSLQAGIGFQAGAQAYESPDGHWYFNAKAGAALGLGASGSVSLDIDVPKIEHTVQEYGGAAWSAVQNAAGSVEYAAGQAASAIGKAYLNSAPYGGMW